MILLWLALASDPLPRGPLPRDIARYVEQHQLCEHFRGEEPYDAAREREILRGITRNCRSLRRNHRRLSSKYRRDPVTLQVIAAHPVEE